jgi:hypothetical protein
VSTLAEAATHKAGGTPLFECKSVVHIQRRFRHEFCVDRCSMFKNCYFKKMSMI